MTQGEEAAVQAAMKAVEEDTIRRCVEAARAYGRRKANPRPTSKMAAAKIQAANEIAHLLQAIERKKIN